MELEKLDRINRHPMQKYFELLEEAAKRPPSDEDILLSMRANGSLQGSILADNWNKAHPNDLRFRYGTPSSLLETNGQGSTAGQTGAQNALAQMTSAETRAANAAKSKQAHAALAQIQKQLAAVNAKMKSDVEKVMEISREQDEEDMREESSIHQGLPTSFLEEVSKLDSPKLEELKKQLHASIAKMKKDMSLHESDEEQERREMRVEPSSLMQDARARVESGIQVGFSEEVPKGLEKIAEKLHNEQLSLRKADEEMRDSTPGGNVLGRFASFLQEKKGEPDMEQQ